MNENDPVQKLLQRLSNVEEQATEARKAAESSSGKNKDALEAARRDLETKIAEIKAAIDQIAASQKKLAEMPPPAAPPGLKQEDLTNSFQKWRAELLAEQRKMIDDAELRIKAAVLTAMPEEADPDRSFNCTNPKCGELLELEPDMKPGEDFKCPKCGKEYKLEEDKPVESANA